MLKHLEIEVKELGDRVNNVMPREVEQESEKLRKLQEEVKRASHLSNGKKSYMAMDVESFKTKPCVQLINHLLLASSSLFSCLSLCKNSSSSLSAAVKTSSQ
jgi:hypothetical protein